MSGVLHNIDSSDYAIYPVSVRHRLHAILKVHNEKIEQRRKKHTSELLEAVRKARIAFETQITTLGNALQNYDLERVEAILVEELMANDAVILAEWPKIDGLTFAIPGKPPTQYDPNKDVIVDMHSLHISAKTTNCPSSSGCLHYLNKARVEAIAKSNFPFGVKGVSESIPEESWPHVVGEKHATGLILEHERAADDTCKFIVPLYVARLREQFEQSPPRPNFDAVLRTARGHSIPFQPMRSPAGNLEIIDF